MGIGGIKIGVCERTRRITRARGTGRLSLAKRFQQGHLLYDFLMEAAAVPGREKEGIGLTKMSFKKVLQKGLT
jgi:hypothetical protein